MNTLWRIFPLQIYEPAMNMAIDEALYQLKINNPNQFPNTIRFYRWNPSAVSIGKNQILNDEVDLTACEKHHIAVIRRITGGGAVFHMYEGEITYSIITDLSILNILSANELYRKIIAALGKGLEHMGIKSDYGQIHCPSLFVKEKKISGNAQAMSSSIALQHGTMLVDYNPELMYTVLRARPDKPRTRMIQSVYAHVTTIKQETNVTDFNTIANALELGFKKEFNITNESLLDPILTKEEISLAETLAKERYTNIEWTENRREPQLPVLITE